jgi:hypothetical protein
MTKSRTSKKALPKEVWIALLGFLGVVITALLTSPILLEVLKQTSTQSNASPTSSPVISGTATLVSNTPMPKYTSTSGVTSTQPIEVVFALDETSNVPGMLTIQSTNGKTMVSISITPGSRQTVKLPAGDYIWTIEGLIPPPPVPPPCVEIVVVASSQTGKLSVKPEGALEVKIPFVGLEMRPIPNCP